MRILKLAVVLLGTSALLLPGLSPAQATGGKKAAAAYGKPTARANPNVNRPKPSASAGHSANNGSGARSRQQANRPNKGKGHNNVVAGNTVVVNKPAGGGYYDNGRYHDRPDWDDDDDDFLEFVGKTAAVTAGVSVVAAVIGSVVEDKPDDCQPVNAYGQSYLYCNGTYYQQVSQGYQVVAPPQ